MTLKKSIATEGSGGITLTSEDIEDIITVIN